eukprot:TRINITY_DN15004_c0_g1_i1.p1 TRINITY_DN15004_c0_g1~~TRINITY_DN15004_c0_g1_i1.p1  ORF type:complete len:232 (+),score=34.19 TRINITY_DN15004_c0_g1_i1:602-1297(+)
MHLNTDMASRWSSLWLIRAPLPSTRCLGALVPCCWGRVASTQRLAVVGRGPSLKRLYGRSELCVVAPGDAPMLGQRLSDVIAAGCLPVVLVGPGSYPVLPLQSAVAWDDFVIIVRLGEPSSPHALFAARRELRRLLSMKQAELERRREKLLQWRPRLALRQGQRCSGGGVPPGGVRPDAGDLMLEEIKLLQAVWRRQLPAAGLDLNSSVCDGGMLMGPRCGALQTLLPSWQ